MAVGALTPLTALPVWKLSSWTDFVANSSILVVKPLMLSLCHGRGITIGSLLHHTWCLVYCATCATDVKTEPSWCQNGLLRPGGPSLPSMVPGMVLWQHPWESNLRGVFSSWARQQSLFLLQECHLFVYWLWSCVFLVYMFFVASLECYRLSIYVEWLLLWTSPASCSGCSVYPLYSFYQPVMGVFCWQVSCFVVVSSVAVCYGNSCFFWSTVMVS